MSLQAMVGGSRKTSAVRGIAAAALLLCGRGAATFVAGADDDVAAVNVLRAGLDEWEHSVEFRCSFRYRTTFAARIEDALLGKFNDALGPKEGLLDARGNLSKKGNLVRLRLDYGQPPKPLDEPSGANLPRKATLSQVWTNVSYDECSNGEVVAAYKFPHGSGDPHNEMYFRKLKPHSGQMEPRPCLGGANAEGQLNPLNPLCNARGRPLEPWDLGDAVQSDTATVEVTSSQRRHVHLRRVSSYGTQERWVTVWVEPELPVVERILEEVKDATGKEMTHTEIVMRKFVPCPGGKVPSEIVHATRNPTSGLINVRLWSSDDLGAQPVRNEDFVIDTGPGALVIGLQHPPAGAGGSHHFDMRKITLKDVKDFKKLEANEPAPSVLAPAGTRLNVSWVLLALNAAALVVLIVFIVARRTRTRRAG